MSSKLRILSFLVPVLCFPIIVPAQGLAPLPKAEEVVTGSLANGLRYYLVSNPAYKGMLDIALVQKAGSDDEPYGRKGDAVVRSRAALTSLDHFGGVSPYSYMYGKRLWPRAEGYARVDEHSTIYRFDNIVTARQGAIVDSTLLMLFDIIDRDQGPMAKVYSTDNQAIVVAGDLIPSEMLGKMNMLSLFVVGRTEGERKAQYEWHNLMTPDVKVVEGPPSVTVQYRSARTPGDRMNTAVPLVTSRYAEELKVLLRRRLHLAYLRAGIPVGEIGFRYDGSRVQGSDEVFSITVSTSAENLSAALKILSGVLADLDENGVGTDEYADVVGTVSLRAYEKYGSPTTDNSRYMEACISSFLYGSSLASDQTSFRFFVGRKMDPDRATQLFSNYVSALLDRSRNLTILWSGEMDEKTVLKTFHSAWTPLGVSSQALRGDTLSLGNGSRSKIKTTLPENMFGGEVWTFANGIKVIYKKMPVKGFFRWQWMLKGGYSSLPGISAGEGGLLPDMLYLSNVAGMNPERFFGMLEANGISLETEISFSETALSGCAPDSKLPLLLKSLSALARERSTNGKAWEYYRRCEGLRNTGRSVECVLDSLVHQTVTYSPWKRPGKIREDLPARAERFYERTFAKMNDGVLIIVGGMDKDLVAKTLSQHMGAFRTEKASSIRSRIRHGMREGRISYRTASAEPSMALFLTTPFNYTAENFMAANIAAFTMKDHISAAVSSLGWRADADWELRMFPDESLDMTVYLERVSPDGIPATMAREDSVDVVLSRVRKAVDELGSRGISERELSVGKSVVANYYSSWYSDPRSVMRMLVLRYSYGKDLISAYGSKISSVTSDAVNPLLSNMAKGVSGEYLVSRAFVPAPVEAMLPEPGLPYIPPVTYIKGAYSFDGSILPPAPFSLDSLLNVPVNDYGEDSTHIAWRDSVVINKALRALEPDIESILDGTE